MLRLQWSAEKQDFELPDQTDCALSRARPEILCFSVDNDLHGCPLYVHIDGPRTMGLFVLVISVASSNYSVA